MADLPQEGTFKIAAIGPMKEGTSAKGNHWRVFSLQFSDEPQWYDTFWTPKEEPRMGMELTGTKSYDEKFTSYKFDIKRDGGKNSWNPAAANATVVLASVDIINGFLALPGHYELWDKGSKELKPKFEKYLATVAAVIPRLKDQTIGMGSLSAEAQAGTAPAQKSGDPDAGAAPAIATYPGDPGPQDPGDTGDGEEDLPI